MPQKGTTKAGTEARRQKVYALVLKGKTNKEIAQALKISERIATNDRNKVMQKFTDRSDKRLRELAARRLAMLQDLQEAHYDNVREGADSKTFIWAFERMGKESGLDEYLDNLTNKDDKPLAVDAPVLNPGERT